MLITMTRHSKYLLREDRALKYGAGGEGVAHHR